jgi:hypothetical protein
MLSQQSMKGTIMLYNSKGQPVSLPKGFATMSTVSQEKLLAPLREVHEPIKGTGKMFSLGERARLKQQQ